MTPAQRRIAAANRLDADRNSAAIRESVLACIPHAVSLLDVLAERGEDATEWAIARVESHPMRNMQTREVVGYALPAEEWRRIRAALSGFTPTIEEES